MEFITSNPKQPDVSLTDVPVLTNESEPLVQPSAIRVNLRDYGFSKAGEHYGDAGALDNLFNQIRQGFVLDENANDEKQRQERVKVDTEIDGIAQMVGELNTEIRRINETEIPKIEGAIDLINEDIHQIELNALRATKDPKYINRFNLRLYWTVFIPATLFLILFYVSAFHSG